MDLVVYLHLPEIQSSEMKFDQLFSNIKSHMIENIFLEYHGEVIKNALIEDFSTMYKVKEIVGGKEQGVLLFFNEHS